MGVIRCSTLETPMVALRVLHFAELLNEEEHPTSAAALDALRATPAIPTAFHVVLPIHTETGTIYS
jgi:hypothetical protein